MPIHVKFELTNACISWCKEQHFINQNNLFVADLTILGIALISILIHNVIYSYYTEIIDKFEIKEKVLDKIYQASIYFAFILIVIFIIKVILK